MSVQLGNLAISSGVDTKFGEVPSDGVKAILIGNESGLTVTITMQGGGVQKTLYPSTVDWFAVNPGFNGNIVIHPVSILNNLSSWPASSLIFDAIGITDPEEASMYPLSLNRNTNIGNSVATVGGSTLNVINDNNANGTQIVEATVTGDGSSAVSLKNNGTLVLGNATHPGSISSDNAKFTTDGSGNVIEQSATVQGNLTVSGTASVTGTSTLTGDVTHTGKLVANGTSTVINGSVAGNVSFFTPIWGTALKILIILTSTTYNDVTAHTFVFPSLVTAGLVYMGNMGTTTVAFKNGASAENTDVTTALGGAAAGSHSNVASIKSDSLGMFDATGQADRVVFTPGGSISNGVFIFIGA